MNHSHTPLPWRVKFPLKDDAVVPHWPATRQSFVIETPRGDYLCLRHPDAMEIPLSEAQANADLMAAAPALVEACQLAVEQMDETVDMLEHWAKVSVVGGWSTHQVESNRRQADLLRVQAARIRRAIARAAQA